MTSKKTLVIERIFDELLNPETGDLKRALVTQEDIKSAIRWCQETHGTRLSDKNPANFFKDIIRRPSASSHWPERLKQLGWTARQVTGKGNAFEFQKYTAGQTEPFPNKFKMSRTIERLRIQSLSIPVQSKELGRSDESYLIQVAVNLAIVETHFALHSDLPIQEIHHLQNNVKLHEAEMDAVFSATLNEKKGEERIIIICEAKMAKERIIEEQITSQARAAFEIMSQIDLVVPSLIQAQGNAVYFLEFQGVRRNDINNFNELTIASQCLYELVPKVKGI